MSAPDRDRVAGGNRTCLDSRLGYVSPAASLFLQDCRKLGCSPWEPASWTGRSLQWEFAPEPSPGKAVPAQSVI